jgi:DNA-binding NarL/FixJ family response regulator
MNAIWAETWDLVLLDISMPGRSSLELLKEMRAQKPKLPVLILSMHPEEQFSIRAPRAGAAGYISKSAASGVLLQAMATVLNGGKFISQRSAQLLATDVAVDESEPLHVRLSDREFDLLLRIGRGQSVTDIAVALHLSVKTVSTYRTKVLAKTGLRNNAEMVQYALRDKLVD